MGKYNPISDLEGRPPEGAHLAVFTDRSGLATALPPGAVFAEILDPTRPDKITRMILTEVKHGKWKFRCACGNPRCTVQIEAKLTQTGSH